MWTGSTQLAHAGVVEEDADLGGCDVVGLHRAVDPELAGDLLLLLTGEPAVEALLLAAALKTSSMRMRFQSPIQLLQHGGRSGCEERVRGRLIGGEAEVRLAQQDVDGVVGDDLDTVDGHAPAIERMLRARPDPARPPRRL